MRWNVARNSHMLRPPTSHPLSLIHLLPPTDPTGAASGKFMPRRASISAPPPSLVVLY